MTNPSTREEPGDFDPKAYEAEARERWGGTDAYRDSARRTAGYTRQDWEASRREADEINAEFLDLMASGAEAFSSEAAAVVDRHRDQISRWFYECTPEIHSGLGRMYVDDARFTENIDQAGDGLAGYMAKAIAARYRN